MADLDKNLAHDRLLNMARGMLGEWSRGDEVPVGPDRAVCSNDEAARAIMHAVAVLDAVVEGRLENRGQAVSAISLLMLARDRLVPLPEVDDPRLEGDPVRDDLATVLDVMRLGEMEHFNTD